MNSKIRRAVRTRGTSPEMSPPRNRSISRAILHHKGGSVPRVNGMP
ncbi:hypothetical protein [Celeribacter sp.]